VKSREASTRFENFLEVVESYAMFKRSYFIFMLLFGFLFNLSNSNLPLNSFLRSHSAYLYFTKQLLSFTCITHIKCVSIATTCATQHLNCKKLK